MTTPDYPPPTEVPTSGGIDPQQMADMTAEWMASAAHDPLLGARLALAKTTVHVHFSDSVGCTFMLEEHPVGAEPRIVGDAEIELWGSPELFYDLVTRRKQMAMVIAYGELKYRGPVRKFLRIIPILRSIDFAPYQKISNGTGSD